MRGEIDILLRDRADRALTEALTRGVPVVVDTSGVTFLGATGVALLLRCARSCAERGLTFSAGPSSPQVEALLAELDLSDVLGGAEAARRG